MLYFDRKSRPKTPRSIVLQIQVSVYRLNPFRLVSNEYLATRAKKNVNMDSLVKMNRFHIKQNVLNVKSTLVDI